MAAFYTHPEFGPVTAVYGGKEGEEVTLSMGCRTCASSQWTTYKLPAPVGYEANGTPLFDLTPDHKVCCGRTIRPGVPVVVNKALGGIWAWEHGVVLDVVGTFIPNVAPVALVLGANGGRAWVPMYNLARDTGRDAEVHGREVLAEVMRGLRGKHLCEGGCGREIGERRRWCHECQDQEEREVPDEVCLHRPYVPQSRCGQCGEWLP